MALIELFEPRVFALAAVLALAIATQTAIGFGAALICLTLGTYFYGVQELVTVLVPLFLFQTSWIAWKHRQHIDHGLLLRRIFPVMGVGLVIGSVVSHLVSGDLLKQVFGVLILLFALRETWLLVKRIEVDTQTQLHPAVASGWLLCAGAIHAIYATGGPPLVYVMQRYGLDKQVFRTTLTFVWTVLNIVLTGRFIAEGRLTTGGLLPMLPLLLALPVGIAVGELLHDRVDEHRFKLATFSVLSVAALGLIFG